MEEKRNEEMVAFNSMVNSVRVQGLQAHRRKILLQWKKNECMRMKKKITETQGKITQLLKKKRRLDSFFASKDVTKKFNLDASMSFIISALKSQIMERKNHMDTMRCEMNQFVNEHRQTWNEADSVWRHCPRMNRAEELRKLLADLKQENQMILEEKAAKKLAAIKSKQEFFDTIIAFAEMMVLKEKTVNLAKETKILSERLNAKDSDNEENDENIAGDFASFDMEINASDGDPCLQESFNDNEYDLNCSVLSLDASIDQLRFTYGSSLGAPVAASTPYAVEIIQAQDEDNLEPDPPQIETPKPVEEQHEPINQSEEIDYHTKYAKSPETFPISEAVSPQSIPPSVPTGFNFLNSVQEAAGASISLFGFGTTEPKTSSSIFNLF